MNNDTFDEHEEELLVAAAMRTLSVMTDSWSHDELTVDDMCNQLDGLSAVLDGKMDFQEFSVANNLIGRERLN